MVHILRCGMGSEHLPNATRCKIVSVRIHKYEVMQWCYYPSVSSPTLDVLLMIHKSQVRQTADVPNDIKYIYFIIAAHLHILNTKHFALFHSHSHFRVEALLREESVDIPSLFVCAFVPLAQGRTFHVRCSLCSPYLNWNINNFHFYSLRSHFCHIYFFFHSPI